MEDLWSHSRLERLCAALCLVNACLTHNHPPLPFTEAPIPASEVHRPSSIMVLHDRLTLINRGPSPKPPATPGRLSEQPAGGAQEQVLDKIIDSLRDAVVDTIKASARFSVQHCITTHLLSVYRVAGGFERGGEGLAYDSRLLVRYTQRYKEDSPRRPIYR